MEVALFKIIKKLALALAVVALSASFGHSQQDRALQSGAAEGDSARPAAFHLPGQWGGQVKAQLAASRPDAGTPMGGGTNYDAVLSGRLKYRFDFSDRWNLAAADEMVFISGDTWRKTRQLAAQFPAAADNAILLNPLVIEDDRRLFNLTATIAESDHEILYNRIDRLVLSWQPDWGLVRVGRQAVTWGNGLIFNPMDLFNPFAPTDIARDYKTGDDMVFLQTQVEESGNFQSLYVPRRNPSSGQVEWNRSSLAAKYHFATGLLETDLMAARHYGNFILGLGNSGYLGGAAWRCDAVWTLQDDDAEDISYLSVVANTDYSWVWFGKNFYGLVEYFYNGMGSDDYSAAIANPAFTERFARGELFTLGRNYLSGTLQVELHPLVNAYLTSICNVGDPSGILQPRLIWDLLQNVQITLGAGLYYGGPGTEFGGFPIPATTLIQKPADTVFLWTTYYF